MTTTNKTDSVGTPTDSLVIKEELKMKSKKSILSIVLASAMATTCAVAISQLSFNDESATKGVYPATFTAFAESVGQTDTLSTAWLVSNDDNYTLFATAFKVGEGKTYTDIGYTVSVDGAEAVVYSSENNYYTGISINTTSGVITQSTTDIFGEIDATGMIVDEFEYDPAKEYVITPYMTLEDGTVETGRAVSVAEQQGVAETCEHDFVYDYGYAKTVNASWATCQTCGIKSWAQYAHEVNNAGGTVHNDQVLSNSGSRKNYTFNGGDVADKNNYTQIMVGGKGNWVNDVATSDTLKSKTSIDYKFNVTADAEGKAKVYVNVRSTNDSGDKINKPVQLNKCLKLYVDGVEYEISVVDLKEGVNKINCHFFKDTTLGTYNGKPYGVYFSYMRVEQIAPFDCETGNHNLTYVEAVAMDCEHDGVKAHYACADCGRLFDENMQPTNKRNVTIVSSKAGHAYDVPRYVDASSHKATCVVCGKEKVEAHKHESGQTHVIIAKAPSKTWYVAGETLNTDRMEVYTSTVCADGCKNNAKVTNYEIEYANGNAFAVGDTFVTIKVGDEAAKLPVMVVASADKMFTIDNKLADGTTNNPNCSVKDAGTGQGVQSRTDDQGGKGQSAYGGSYITNVATGDVLTAKFTATAGSSGRITLQAASNATVKGTGSQSPPEYCQALQVNEIMVIKVNGEIVEIADNVILNGTVSNLEASSNRWVWTNWTTIDFGEFDFVEGENVIEITFISSAKLGSFGTSQACAQLDCINVFFD